MPQAAYDETRDECAPSRPVATTPKAPASSQSILQPSMILRIMSAIDSEVEPKRNCNARDILAPPASSLLPLLVDDASATAFPQANPISAAFTAVAPAC
jgi:hypothetical protein